MNACYGSSRSVLRPRRFLLPLRFAVGAGVLLVVGCGENPTDPSEPSFSRVTPGASFDWTVPPRFGADRDGDGLIDYPRTQEGINPSSWTVNFDACDLSGSKYTWYVDRFPVAFLTSCEYTHEFAAEGVYDVALHVVGARGPSVWVEQVVTVQDWLIVSFGDSYASGEGVPEVPQANDALVQSIEGLFGDLIAARLHLDAVEANLQEAFEQKGLAEEILATAKQRRSEFLAACNIEGFTDIKVCLDFLVDRALSFELFQQASDHFEQALQNASERLESLTNAYDEALAAFEAAQSAIDNLEGVIVAARDGFQLPLWQEPYANEVWVDDCHRSANAAPARAALALEESDPRTSVTFLHLACSGARIDEFPNNLKMQIPWGNELVGEREIDAVLVSIGGNDANFAQIAIACAVQEPCFLKVPTFDPAAGSDLCFLVRLIGFEEQCNRFFGGLPESAALLLEEGVEALPGRYEKLATDLFPKLAGLLDPQADGPGLQGRGRPGPSLDPVDRVRSSRVYITEYVDMTKDDSRAYCSLDLTDLLGTMPGFSVPEMEWLDLTAGQSINRAVETAATAHGWTFVSGIYDRYASHGYCAEAHWVVRAHETFLIQGDINGMVHPNVRGNVHNGEAIWAALMGDLYPMGLDAAPRAPDSPRASRGIVLPPQIFRRER